MGNGPEFFQTVMGRRFFEDTMPNLVRAVERLSRRGPRFIQLTNPNGTPRYVSAEHIQTFAMKDDGSTTVWIGNEPLAVMESVESIIKMLEAKE